MTGRPEDMQQDPLTDDRSVMEKLFGQWAKSKAKPKGPSWLGSSKSFRQRRKKKNRIARQSRMINAKKR